MLTSILKIFLFTIQDLTPFTLTAGFVGYVKNKMKIKSIPNYGFRIALILFLIMTTKAFAKNEITGDTPSYVGILNCPKPVLFAIHDKGFPENLIHSYNSKKILLDGSTLYIVNIEYGEAQDCPAGCFYEHFVGVISLEKSFMHQLPGPNHNYVLSLLGSQPPFTKQRYNFEKLLENSAVLKLAKKNNQFGWEIFFTQPYPCSWIKIDKGTVTYTSVINEGKNIYESFSGSIFVYLKDGNIQWDFTNLQNTAVKEEKVIIEEKRLKSHNQ